MVKHSPLGGSGAYRWMPPPYGGGCPGSVQLSEGIHDEESEYAALGQAAHILAEHCLRENTDAWEVIGDAILGVVIDKDMADAVQMYLNYIRSSWPDKNKGNFFVERHFHCTELHDLYYGRSDATYVDFEKRHIYPIDYKHGAGIVVDVQWNPQLMYYTCGMLTDLYLWHKIDTATLCIVQPRGWHGDGPIRTWSISVLELEVWLDDILIPAMNNALVSRDTRSGEHCRFCPARGYQCPQLMSDMDELEELMNEIAKKGSAKALTNTQVGRFLTLFDTAKIIAKAADKTAYARLSTGKKIPGRKLVNSRTDREFKDGAEDALKDKFGKNAFTVPELKSPAQIDALPEGTKMTTRWAFKPPGKLRVAAISDARYPVNRDTKSLFKDERKK